VTPYLSIELEQVGAPPNLLAGVGSAVLWEDDTPAAGPATTVPTFLAARYSGDALGLVLPLASSHRYTVDSAAINLVGAAGTWNAANNWTVSLQSRSASLGVDTVLATGTFSTGGSGTVNLSPAAEVDGDETPALAVKFEKVGNPGMLLGADATLTLQSEQLGQPTTYTYDANGNTRTETGPSGTTTYTWNPENRLREINEDGILTTHTYAATGLRRTKTTSSETTEFLWDGLNLFAELDEALATVAQYTDWPGVWGGLTSARRAGNSEWLTFDLSANTRQLLSAAAALQQSYLYRAFGPELTGAAGSNPFRFGGQVGYYSDAAERVYVRARFYEPELGRFVTRDPVVRRGPGGRYGYCRGGVPGIVDPSGLSSIHWDNMIGPFYTHAWIEFDPPCDGMTSIGFWPTRAEDTQDWMPPSYDGNEGLFLAEPIVTYPIQWGEPGIFNSPDDNSKLDYPTTISPLNPAESAELCECVKRALKHEPPEFGLWPYYVCGSWANDMYACATKDRHSPTTSGGHLHPPIGPDYTWVL